MGRRKAFITGNRVVIVDDYNPGDPIPGVTPAKKPAAKKKAAAKKK